MTNLEFALFNISIISIDHSLTGPTWNLSVAVWIFAFISGPILRPIGCFLTSICFSVHVWLLLCRSFHRQPKLIMNANWLVRNWSPITRPTFRMLISHCNRFALNNLLANPGFLIFLRAPVWLVVRLLRLCLVNKLIAGQFTSTIRCVRL